MHPPRGIIIEGVSGAGKTSVLKRVRGMLAERRPGSTTLFLSEHYTERVLEDRRAAGELSYGDILNHVEGRLMPLVEASCRLQREGKFSEREGNGMVRVLLERWCGGMFANLIADGRPLPDSASELEERVARNLGRLAELGIRAVVLEVPPRHLDALIQSTREHRNEAWTVYLDRLDREHGGLTAYYHRWQRALLDHYRSQPQVSFIAVEPPFTVLQYDAIAARIYKLIDAVRR